LPEISILIPVYNVEEYLSQCLDSILNQTFKDFECICVNDGSTDNSLSILQEYASKDNRIKIINQKNKGVSATRNVCLENSSGKYIAFVDSDDWITDNYLEILYNELERLQYDIAICNHQLYYPEDNKFISFASKIVMNEETANFNKFVCGYNFGAVWAKLYRRQFIKKNKLFFLENVVMEDYIFSITAYLLTNKIISIKNNLYFYRRQNLGIMYDSDKVTISQFYNNFYLIKDLRKRKINCSEIENYLIRNFFHNLADVYKRVKKSNYGIAELFNKSLDALYFFNTIKKDLKLKYKIAIPVSLKLFLIFKKNIFYLRKLFMLIY